MTEPGVVQIIPDTTGWKATYSFRDSGDDEPMVFVPLVGWALLRDGSISALVPTNDGKAVFCEDMTGDDGELVFENLSCSCEDHQEDH